ncbi:MAG: penicillin-binding protein 2 [Olsenella sp.]|nr:penicillin-binding protein 2 [Olsenella sp.]
MGSIILVIILVAALASTVFAYLILSSQGGTFKLDIGGQTPRASGGDDNSPEKGFKHRLQGLSVVTGGVLGVILARLWGMQLLSSDDYAELAESNRTRTVTTRAARGRIIDRNGIELVSNRPSLAVVANKDILDDDVKVRLLANMLGMPYVAVRRKIQSETEGAQNLRTVAADVNLRQVAYIGEHPDVFEGASVEERTQRIYPNGDLAAHVLGYTGNPTQEQLDAAAEGDLGSISYEAGDTVGQSGVEYQYESVLQGIRGEQVVYVDANGRVVEQSTSVAPTSGSDVVLTIDAKIQRGAEAGLAHAIQASRDKGNASCKAGAVVVLDATDGGVLALASAPTFSPSAFIGGISADDWAQISSEKADWPMVNRAVSGQYMSASTIKPLSTFAALDYGIATKDSHYVCEGFWTGFGREYGKYCWNHDGHGGLSLRDGITYSCDVVFYEIAKGFFLSDDNKEGLQETFRRWGLGKSCQIDLPSEAVGRVPDAEWKWNYFSDYSEADRTWQGGDTTNIAIGQGDLLVTPIQMACVYMGIANRGTIWKPHVLKSIQSHAGGSVIEYKPEVLNAPEESKENFDLVIDGLKGVIYEESESMTQHFLNLSHDVAGKTGSGEIGNDPATGWFVAFSPIESPKYVVAAVIEKGGFGATSAMYAVRDTLGSIYDEPDDVTESIDTAME